MRISDWSSDVCSSDLEMTHVWQAQRGGRWYLPLMRHPFCRYAYDIVPGKPFRRYGLEQQAEIVRHAFLLRRGVPVEGKPPLPVFEALLPFSRSSAVSTFRRRSDERRVGQECVRPGRT